jgi:DNA-binding NarL/FixJ family response regulator
MATKKAATNRKAPRKIFIVDDHPMMRMGLAEFLNKQPGLTVCGEAGSAQEALAAIGHLNPDLVVVDISLPDKNGIELVKDVVAMHPELPAIVHSMHDEMIYAERALRAGARGYLMKHEGGIKLAEAIRQVLEGRICVSDRMSAKILAIFSGHRNTSESSPVENLSDREFEVFQLVGEGLGTEEIANRLHLSDKTVEVHRVNIKRKLRIATARELTHYAVRWVESQKQV